MPPDATSIALIGPVQRVAPHAPVVAPVRRRTSGIVRAPARIACSIVLRRMPRQMHTTWKPCSTAASGVLVTEEAATGAGCADGATEAGTSAGKVAGGAPRAGSLGEPGADGSWLVKRGTRRVIVRWADVDAFFVGFLG